MSCSLHGSMKDLSLKQTLPLADFHAGLLSWLNENLEMFVFVEGGKVE